LFPNIGLDESKFPHIAVLDRKRFFDEIAEKSGFDPLLARNWYQITYSKFASEKGASIMSSYYKGSFVKALMHLYPTIGLVKEEFSKPRSHWQNAINRRKFFEDFAHSKGFDPLIPENWYAIPMEQIQHIKGASTIYQYYKNNIQALVSLFPDIGLDKTKFEKNPINYWNDTRNRKKFFDHFAKEQGFDPLVPDNWYLVNRSAVLDLKKGHSVLNQYNGSLTKALLHIYDSIGLDKDKFRAFPR